MGFLLKIAIFAVVAYTAWNTVKRFLGLGLPPQPRREAAPPPSRRPVVEDTRLCTVCNAYVSTSAGRCGQAHCPQN